jgi:plastocyanin
MVNRQILENFGLVLDSEETMDISSAEGQAMVDKYEIPRVPTILISPEGSEYSAFVSAWEQVGSIEDDGWFVMRNPEILGKTVSLEESGDGESEVNEFSVEGTEFSFSPSTITVNKGDTVRIVFKNTGEVLHDFSIESLGLKTDLVGPGNSETIEFIPSSSGTFKFICTVPGHMEAGMEGEIIVK